MFYEMFSEWIKIFEIREQRRNIGIYHDMTFKIYTKEQGHNRPHIHVEYQNKNISISLDEEIEVIQGNLKSSQQNIALQWVKNNINDLRQQWNTLVNSGIKINIKGNLEHE